jgi:hypothetical protein
MFCGTVESVQVSKRRRVDFGSWRDASHSRTNQTDVTATTPSKIRLRAIDYILDKVDNAAKMHSVVLDSCPRLQEMCAAVGLPQKTSMARLSALRLAMMPAPGSMVQHLAGSRWS